MNVFIFNTIGGKSLAERQRVCLRALSHRQTKLHLLHNIYSYDIIILEYDDPVVTTQKVKWGEKSWIWRIECPDIWSEMRKLNTNEYLAIDDQARFWRISTNPSDKQAYNNPQ